MKKKATATLNSYVKNLCANYNKNENKCVFEYPCLVVNRKRCNYFERAVLGKPDYPYRTPGYNYKKIFQQYAEIKKDLKGKLHQLKINVCMSCGDAIPPRFTYCEKCGKTQKRLAARERVKKHRCNASNDKKRATGL